MRMLRYRFKKYENKLLSCCTRAHEGELQLRYTNIAMNLVYIDAGCLYRGESHICQMDSTFIEAYQRAVDSNRIIILYFICD